jgi:hypothetical protein
MNKESWGKWTGGTVTARNRSSGEPSGVWSLFQNDLFIVTCVPFQCDWGWCVHVVMRLKPDATPLSGLTWAVKQQIKDELLGPHRVAVEVFPPQAQLIDQADAYHLWVLPDGFQLPFGVEETSE